MVMDVMKEHELIKACIEADHKWATADHKWDEAYRELHEVRSALREYRASNAQQGEKVGK